MKHIQTFESFINEDINPERTGLFLKTNVEVDQDFVEVGNILKKRHIQYFWSSHWGVLLFNTKQEKDKAEKLLKSARRLAEGNEVTESFDGFEDMLSEGKMKEIYTMAQEADSYDDFKKEVMKAHPTLKQDPSIDSWLEEVFNSAQKMEEQHGMGTSDRIQVAKELSKIAKMDEDRAETAVDSFLENSGLTLMRQYWSAFAKSPKDAAKVVYKNWIE